MFKNKSGFTLIELIVVIAVLGILAAIIVPNISSFQNEARDVQLTADVRNLQTALDMYRAKSDSGVAEPVMAFDVTGTMTDVSFTVLNEDETASETFKALDLSGLYPEFLRKAPKYVKNATLFTAGGDQSPAVANADYTKGEVVAGILQDANGSTAIVKFAAHVGNVDKVVR